VKNNPRSLASQILDRIEEDRAFAEPLLDSCLSGSALGSAQDRGLLTELVYGTLRMRNRMDWIIRTHYRGDFGSMKTGLKNILRIALYQVMFADRIPSYAAVDEAVKMTKTRYPGRSDLVNAILRNAVRKMKEIQYPDFDEDPAHHISVYHSHPRWLVEKWIKELGVEETLELCRSNNKIPPMTLRANVLKAKRTEIMEKLASEGIEIHPTKYSPDGVVLFRPYKPIREMDLLKNGLVQFQDEASQLISHLVSPRPGEKILDICAGVGIKTFHLAGLMKNSGAVLALDAMGKKLETLKKASRKMGSTIIDTVVADATEDIGKQYHEKFDRILVDAPCSGLGTVRRKPEIKWHRAAQDLEKMSILQKKMLNSSARYLRKGGVIVYSTCTIASEENEGVIKDFLEKTPGFRCIRPPAPIRGEKLNDEGFFRMYPHRHETDGFFGALLKKEGN
jgi:16S rRNA (cytosine967-C5)-methyltransferase